MLFKSRENLLGSHLVNFHLDLDLLQLEEKEIEHDFVAVLNEELYGIEDDIQQWEQQLFVIFILLIACQFLFNELANISILQHQPRTKHDHDVNSLHDNEALYHATDNLSLPRLQLIHLQRPNRIHHVCDVEHRIRYHVLQLGVFVHEAFFGDVAITIAHLFSIIIIKL